MTLNIQQTIRNLNRAAPTYNQSSVLQQAIAKQLLERLAWIHLNPEIIIDIQAATGFFAQALAERYLNTQVIAFDLSPRLLDYIDQLPAIVADPRSLPLIDQRVDLVCTVLLPWYLNHRALFSEAQRVLRSDGLFFFATLGPDTCYELRRSWAAVDDSPPMHQFVDMHELGDHLLQAGFHDPVVDSSYITLTYRTIKGLFNDLKGCGAQYTGMKRRLQLTGKQRFQSLTEAYQQYQTDDQLLPATFEIIFGHAWCLEKQSPRSQEIAIPLSQIQLE